MDGTDLGGLSSSEKDVDSFLAHYGVKGMKWGIRKDRRGGVVSRRRARRAAKDETPKRTSSDHKKASRLKTKSADQMSNAELRQLNERMNLERNYSQLMASQAAKTPLQKGQSFVKGTITVARTAQEIYNLANSPAGKAVREAIRKR